MIYYDTHWFLYYFYEEGNRMSQRKVFVSYNFADREVAHTVNNMMQQSLAGHYDFHFMRDFSAYGEAVIDREIRKALEPCDVVLFVIGNNNHNSPWIAREAQLAISKGHAIVLTRLPGTTGAPPHQLYVYQNSMVGWNPNALANALG